MVAGAANVGMLGAWVTDVAAVSAQAEDSQVVVASDAAVQVAGAPSAGKHTENFGSFALCKVHL